VPPQQEKGLAGFIQGEIKIVADEINNMLIIQASPQDYDVIQETIKALDIVPRQVLIDAKIYEVKLTGALSLGVSYFLQQRSDVPKITTASFSTAATDTLPAGLNISTATLIGQTKELLTFLHAQESRSRTRVLSSPSVLASDNMVARIQVGAEVPILSSQGIVPGGTGGTSLFTNTVLNRNTGVILKVTPRINSSGLVTLKIAQEVSAPVAPVTGGIQSPTISIRSVDTQATVKDGETVAIGGIIQDNRFLSKNRIPILGDIPGLGLLFGDTSYNKDRTELIALITPHVIQDTETAADVTDELKSQLKGLKKELKRLEPPSEQ
jgi:general secretion pathway protein D